jgi:hydroxyethylthiazole kinase
MLTRQLKLAVVRGNASEVLSYRSEAVRTKGVEAIHSVEQAAEAVRETARLISAVVAVTGPVDLITDGETVIRCRNGHPLLGMVTGTGCAATTSIAAFAGVTPDPLEATAAGLALFGLAGELAARKAQAPGSYQVALLDALYQITPDEFQAEAKLERA